MAEFGNSIGNFKNATMKDIADLKRVVAIGLFSAIVEDTPVLTGRLRANWNCSANEPDFKKTDLIDKEGSATIGKLEFVALGAEAEDAIYFTNSLPYAARIEFEGWSHTKSPAGMVRKNVIRFKKLVSASLKGSRFGV